MSGSAGVDPPSDLAELFLLGPTASRKDRTASHLAALLREVGKPVEILGLESTDLATDDFFVANQDGMNAPVHADRLDRSLNDCPGGEIPAHGIHGNPGSSGRAIRGR